MRLYVVDHNERRFPVRVGYLYQGNSKPKLGWREVWNLQGFGVINKHSLAVPVTPENIRNVRFPILGSPSTLSPVGSGNWDLYLHFGDVGYRVKTTSNSSSGTVFFGAFNLYGHGFGGIANLVTRERVVKLNGKTTYEYCIDWNARTSGSTNGTNFPVKIRLYNETRWISFKKQFSNADRVKFFQNNLQLYCEDLAAWYSGQVLSGTNGVYGETSPIVPHTAKVLESVYTDLSPRTVKSLFNHYSHDLITSVNKVYGEKMGELEASAFDQVQKFDGNFYVFLSKLSIPGSTTLQTFKDLSSAIDRAYDIQKSGEIVKGLAGSWLATRFGDRLLMGSITDLTNSIFDYLLSVDPYPLGYVRGRSRLTHHLSDGMWDCDISYACNLALTPKDYNGLMRLIRTAYEWDFYPTLANVWDAVPLSFVVNWFLDIGSIFEDIDRLAQSRYYDVLGIMNSTSVTSSLPVLPQISIKYYSRQFEPSLHLGVSNISVGLPSAFNVVDGISLIASML